MVSHRLHTFLSKLSLRRATAHIAEHASPGGISIHALLAESDILDFFRVIHMKDFYPRSPCGERPSGQIFGPAVCIIISIHALLAESDLVIAIQSVPVFSFLSTLSLRRATFVFSRMGVGLLAFLSTLSLRRATSALAPKQNPTQRFYPRSPCGERLRGWTLNINGSMFLSTLSLRRATSMAAVC